MKTFPCTSTVLMILGLIAYALLLAAFLLYAPNQDTPGSRPALSAGRQWGNAWQVRAKEEGFFGKSPHIR